MSTVIDVTPQSPSSTPAIEPTTEAIPAPRHWEKPIKKTLYTLNVSPDGTNLYAPEICQLTYPLIKGYAEKIGADFCIINERKRPDWPITIEKFQVAELAARNGDDWSIFVDSDTLISPEFFDITAHMSKDTVAHNGNDMSSVRFRPDNYFLRDGRYFGSCTWLVIASDWCMQDLWRLPEFATPEEAFENISITISEHNSGHCKRDHLIDDYTLSRNISRFGLKTTTVIDICGKLGWRTPDGRGASPHLFHLYTLSEKEKLGRMLAVLGTPQGHIIPDPRNPQNAPGGFPPLGIGWGLMDPGKAQELAKKWGLK